MEMENEELIKSTYTFRFFWAFGSVDTKLFINALVEKTEEIVTLCHGKYDRKDYSDPAKDAHTVVRVSFIRKKGDESPAPYLEKMLKFLEAAEEFLSPDEEEEEEQEGKE